MSAKIHTAKAVSGEVVTIVGSNEQENVRPGEYIVFDDDVAADIAVKTNQDLTKPIKRFDMFLIMANLGLAKLGLEPTSYNFTRSMRADIRNVGIDPKQITEYQALISAPAPVKANTISPVDSYVNRINAAVMVAVKAGKTPTNEQITAQVANPQLVPVEFQAAVLARVIQKEPTLDFSF